SMDFPPIQFPIVADASGPYLFVIQDAYGASVSNQVMPVNSIQDAWQLSSDAQIHFIDDWLQGAATHDVTSRDATFFSDDNNPNLTIGDTVLINNAAGNGSTMAGFSNGPATIFPSGAYEMFMTDENGVRISGNATLIPEPSGYVIVNIVAFIVLVVRPRRTNARQ
ncbi:MAG TPA: hypothetical protein VKK61_06755, partial [Tepidisphaeraceae bacterium]|nr:hypothetical protein [Tepidisphaeraceae bacterium]